MDKLKVFTAFSGYDSQCMALDRLGVNYELVGWSEINKYAIRAHNAIYPQWANRNFGDISKIDWNDVPDFDLFTYSFPCQDISFAGQQRGLEEGSGTRSGLLWECRKAIETKRPRYLLMENVKALVSKKFKPVFHKWMTYLDSLGYSNYAKVLNAKDFGIPQNRERIFVVSILGNEVYSFPQPFELNLRLKDILGEDVDESYYLSDKLIDYVFSNGGVEKNIKGAVGVQNGDKPALCITANYYKTPRQGNYLLSPITCAMRGRNPDNPSDRTSGINTEQRIEMGGDVSNCITTVQKDSLVVEPVLVGGVGEQNFGKQWRQGNRIYDANSIAMCLLAQPLGNAGGYSYLYRVEDSRNPQRERVYDVDGISPTIDTMQGGGLEPKIAEPKCVGCTRNKKGYVVKRHLMDYCNTLHTSTGSGGSTDCFVFEPNITGVIYKGRVLKEGGGLYLQSSDNFNRGSLDGISRTLKATKSDAEVVQNYRIRKLTPRECFRLMGVSEEDIDNIQQSGISKTQQYKMAGNSIVVDVLYHIFRKLFIDKKQETSQLTLF